MPMTQKMTSSKTVVKRDATGVTQVQESRFKEGVGFKASKPFSKVFVLFRSLVRVEGIMSINARSDDNAMTITTDLGTVGG